MIRRSTLLVVGAAVAVSAVLIAVIATSVEEGEDRAVDVAAEAGPCHAGADAPASRTRAILDCVAPSLAYISTPLGSGSGILVDGRFVVTNAHVVDPFAAVDLVFGETEHHRSVEVVGVDLAADLALLGPVDTERTTLEIADYEGVSKGDDVYLVGYPGEIDEEPEATISRGILSRVRQARGYGLTFLQTDAAIGGGQSGGALVDAGGRVIGVSGFSFAEEFALALSGQDTRRSIRNIRQQDTPPYRPFPKDGATSGQFRLADSEASQVLTLATGRQSEEVRLELPPEIRPAVYVSDLEGEDVYYENQEAAELAAETGQGGDDPEEVDVPAVPGVFEFEIPARTYALIYVGTRLPEGAEVTFRSTVPLGLYEDTDDGRPVELLERIGGTIDPLEANGDSFLLELQAGEAVEIFAGSPTGDVGFEVVGPGQDGRDATYVDDSGLGLFGVDARDVYRAETAGTHRITVYSADGTATGYVFEVAPA